MSKSLLLQMVITALLSTPFIPVQAALISHISSLNIDGALYDVTFHTNGSDTFNALWDSDGDENFGEAGDTSLLNSQPTFWGNQAGALAAASAIIDALGSTDITSSYGTGVDSFLVPYDRLNFDLTRIVSATDRDYSPSIDESSLAHDPDDYANPYRPYVSFVVSEVPVPGALWLFGTGLIGLIGLARRKKL